ncbi:TetR family transcriptional regulator [Streptomyces sp. 3MP-14]|uniref:TetR family transcriptional regulator n=1 Tax=Streptomyces mimosae TaxID=2586635 RepID=A0A5N6AT75_9ACTN|nr:MULTISPECIES: TetR/AcrR family transcriptional regulator [Streptomyces]KAB8170898.1 TetR family transcriptional regulator [Streptomyces mimosae]KAB8179751.1 TetR family transcriptional regulator [Streptomyces sp. 3MP-14]
MTAIRTARERARDEVTRAIKDEARRQLAADGASRLSLRAVARELGMVSSALYRYFPSRDELLTALIVDAYNALGDAVDGALGAAPDAEPPDRWAAVCRAARAWALAHPHEYALIHGTPVPGYAAPDDTSGPGVRLPLALAAIATQARRAGQLAPPDGGPPPAPVLADAATHVPEHAPGLAPETLAAVLAAWAQLLGLLSTEIFGQFNGVIAAREQFFDHAAAQLGRSVGLRRAGEATG